MASAISRSAKQQTWSRDERERQVSFVRGALQMLNGARDVFDQNGKLLKVGTPTEVRQPRTALRWLHDNGVTMTFPRERPPEPEGLTILRRLNAEAQK